MSAKGQSDEKYKIKVIKIRGSLQEGQQRGEKKKIKEVSQNLSICVCKFKGPSTFGNEKQSPKDTVKFRKTGLSKQDEKTNTQKMTTTKITTTKNQIRYRVLLWRATLEA